MIRRATIATSVAFLLFAVPASGAVRFAEPNGNGPAATCPQSDPCEIRAAISDPSVVAGDEVVVLPGTYDITPGPPLSIAAAITVHGQAGQPRPLFTVQPGTSAVIRLNNAGAVLSDVDLARSTGLFLLAVDRGLAERISATSGGTYACTVGTGTLRDSVCSATGGGVGVAAGDVGGGSGTFAANLLNVTARARGSAGSYAIQANGTTAGTQTTVLARNVIADGDAADTFATASSGGAATLTMVSSNFDVPTASGTGTTTPAGSGDNQTAPPLLANPAAGDFHQLPGSPTIDAGTADSLLGAFDFERQARVDGSAPDIGADEVQTAPDTTIVKGPKPKVKTRKKKAKVQFEFQSSEPGSTFTCALDAAAAVPCASPYTLRVRKGRHTLAVSTTDAAGNPDQTAATYAWKVKRKKRRR